MSMDNNRLNFKPFGNNTDEPLDGGNITNGAMNERDRRLRERAAAFQRVEKRSGSLNQPVTFSQPTIEQTSDITEFPVQQEPVVQPTPIIHQTRPISTIPTPTVQEKPATHTDLSAVNADSFEAPDDTDLVYEARQACEQLTSQDKTELPERHHQPTEQVVETPPTLDDEVLLEDDEDTEPPIGVAADGDTDPSEPEGNTIPYKTDVPQLDIDVSSSTTAEETFNVTDEKPEGAEQEVPQIKLILVDETNQTLNKQLITTADKVAKKYNLTTSEEDAARFTAEIRNTNSPVFKLQTLLDASTASRDFDQYAINRISDFQAMIANTPKSIVPKNASSTVRTNDIKNKDKVVSGQQARMMLAAKLRGMKRVYLVNSGFYVDVRALSNQELNEFISTIQSENIAYGHTLGAHFYLYASMHLKKFFADKLTSIVMDSNLQGWKQGNTLQDNISIHDYRTIMWACASLMFKDGVKFTKICSYCTAEETLTINLNKIIFFNYEPAKEASKLICDKKNVTVDDVRKYRANLDFEVASEFTIPGFRIYRKIPLISEYVTAASAFINRMVIDVTDMQNKQEVQDYIRFTFFRQYTPWIQKIESLDADTGEVEFVIEDTDAILSFFETCSLEETDFAKHMDEYIQSTMMTFIGFPYVECPTCHKVPADIVNGFVAYDIETGFFMMSVMKFQEAAFITKD